MAERICPFWVGYFLVNPLRKFLEDPDTMLGPFVREAMIVLEPGCGMGYFTLPLARMVGPQGRVVAVDVQPRMLSALGRRARKAGLADRIDIRQAGVDGLGVEDLSGQVNFAAVLHVVHEVPDQTAFFTEVWKALKPGGKLLIVEPKGHVSPEEFERTVAVTKKIGFESEALRGKLRGRGAVLTKPLD